MLTSGPGELVSHTARVSAVRAGLEGAVEWADRFGLSVCVSTAVQHVLLGVQPDDLCSLQRTR